MAGLGSTQSLFGPSRLLTMRNQPQPRFDKTPDSSHPQVDLKTILYWPPNADKRSKKSVVWFSYTLGPFAVTLLQNSYGGLNSRWAYRRVFVSQYGVTALGLIGLPFMPE